MASTRSCPGLLAQPQRYIIHRNDGLIHVILSRLNGATNRPAATARSAISGGYAWYTVINSAENAARTWRAGTVTPGIIAVRRTVTPPHYNRHRSTSQRPASAF